VVRDFNAIRCLNERKGLDNGTINSAKMEKFNEFIDNCQFYDILTVGRRYTWYKTK